MPRVLVADDSSVSRTMLIEILRRDPGISVVAEAPNGKEAVELALRHNPDVILMDVLMPVMDGLEATATIMAACPTPIIIVTAIDFSSHSELPYRALEAGAVKLLAKPANVGTPAFARQADELVATVKLMADLKVVTRRRPKEGVARPTRIQAKEVPEVVAIGASSGGPAALATILGSLPAELPLPVLLVQHIARGFTTGLVRWLNGVSPLDVRVAAAGTELAAGQVNVAPDERHLGVSITRRIVLSDGPVIGGHRPSATFLFRSVAAAYGARSLAVILSGMGRDGTDGLLEIKRVGGYVLAQDPRSCVVGSMPAAAIGVGLVDEVLPLEAIAPAIEAAARRRIAST